MWNVLYLWNQTCLALMWNVQFITCESMMFRDQPAAAAHFLFTCAFLPPAASCKTSGVRFTEEPAAAAHSHVHFDEKLHDSVVMVTPQSNGNFLVKVRRSSVSRFRSFWYLWWNHNKMDVDGKCCCDAGSTERFWEFLKRHRLQCEPTSHS